MIEELKKQLANKIPSESTNSNEESSDEEQLPRNLEWSTEESERASERNREPESRLWERDTRCYERASSSSDNAERDLRKKSLFRSQLLLPPGQHPHQTNKFDHPPLLKCCLTLIIWCLYMPGCDVKVPRLKLKSLRTASSALYIGDLAVFIYGRHAVQLKFDPEAVGAHKDVESKPQLDNTKLDAIFDHAQVKSPDTHHARCETNHKKEMQQHKLHQQVDEKKS
ncbi:uncharacterized protein LOC115798545 [Archocentrus centrarchus]|uniref:uncharacterized protein LOC115798545 n=1 Tax=Archocentrus centrarchus TaxID=63155 RepID=UPI0011E9EB53|nr:uncharacterized protein LOC115798545 [Archocentrus centrarchus]